MPYYDVLIITPWVEAALDPSEQPANHPKLIDDYPTILSSDTKVLDWMPLATHRIVDAIGKAQVQGELFRTAFSGFASGTRKGYGVRLPQLVYDEYMANQQAMQLPADPWIAGPHNDDDDNFQLVEFSETVVQEGIRLQENWTGQDVRIIPPNPNQYTVHCILEESVLGTIMNDDTYWYQAGSTFSTDPDDPTPPPGLHNRPLPDLMDAQIKQDYEDWQARQGVNRNLPKRIMSMVSDITYGENSVATIAWQRELTGASARWRIPSRKSLEEVESRLPSLKSQRSFARKFPQQWTPVPAVVPV